MARILMAAVLLGLLLVGPVHAAITLDDVTRMLQAGVSEEVILKVIDADGSQLVITSEDLIALTQAGASNSFLQELIDRSAGAQGTDPGNAYTILERPYSAYASVGWGYDPFDYYFVTWPYYYGWFSPWSYCWSWWYYGGPYCYDYCSSYCYSSNYYDDHYGTRTMWNRDSRGVYSRDSASHASSYLSDKQVRAAGLRDRSGRTRADVATDRTSRVTGRTATERQGRLSRTVTRSGDRSTYTRSTRPTRSTASSHSTRSSYSRTTRGYSSSGARSYAPARSGGFSRGSGAPSRSSAPMHSSAAPSRPHR